MADDIPRWSEAPEAPQELQSLLKSAQQDLPSKAQLSGLEASLGALLEQPPAPGAPAPTAGPAGSLPAAAKLAVLVAVGGLVGTAAWLNSQGNAEQANTPTPDSQASQAVTPPRPAHAESVREHEAPPEPEASQVAAEAPEQPSSQVQKPAPKRAAKPSEASLLSQAQRALKSDPARALAITRQHKRLYPTGALSQEREVIAIEALSRLNKKGSAQQKADAFKEKYPESAHQKKIDTLKR